MHPLDSHSNFQKRKERIKYTSTTSRTNIDILFLFLFFYQPKKKKSYCLSLLMGTGQAFKFLGEVKEGGPIATAVDRVGGQIADTIYYSLVRTPLSAT